MLLLGDAPGVAGDPQLARMRLETALADGGALKRFAQIIEAQGGDPGVIDDPLRLPQPRKKREVRAPRSGVVAALDAGLVGLAAVGVVAGRAHDYLAKRANDHLSVKKIWGFTIVTEDNEVRNFRTHLENVKGALTGGWPRNIKAYFEIADSFKPDVVISDFESWSYLYGVNHMLPVVSVDNMQIINRCRHDAEILAGQEASFQIAKGIIKAKVPGAYHYLITTFFRPPIRKPPTSFLPPFSRPQILPPKPH